MNLEWRCKHFDKLHVNELYALLKLRSEVFVVEQNCVFLDADDNDQFCFHLLGYDQDNLVAHARLVPPNSIYKEASIGRVVSAINYRGKGAGKELMQNAISNLYKLYGEQTIKIGAQLYLRSFYESFGFKKISPVYLEDGIEHIYMLKEIS